MLTAEQIDALRDNAAKLTAPIQAYLLREIARRVAQAGQLTSTAAYQVWKAQQLGVSQRQIKKELRRLLKLSHKEIRRIMYQSAQSGYNLDVSRFPHVQAVPFEQNTVLQQIVSAAAELAEEDFTNLTQTMGMVDPYGNALPLQDAYRACTDFAFGLVSTGAVDYMTAVRQATRNLANKGLRVIDYESGVHTSLEAAVRRNILGGLGLMQEKIIQETHNQLGCNGWEITAHANSAPDHEPIQGRQYSDDAYTALNNSLRRRIGTLNCGHAAFPIILGVNKPQYTAAELEKFRQDNKKGVTIDGRHYTGYEAKQMQRRLERSIRRQKNRIMVDEAAGDSEKLKTDKARLAVLHQRYVEFSRDAGLRTQYERTEVAGFGEKRDNGLANSAKSGILSEKDIYALNQYKSSNVAFPLNSILRGEAPMTEHYRQSAHDIDQALLKLPMYQGTVYRSVWSAKMVDVESFWQKYTPGEVVTEPAYTSASTEVYDKTADVQMIIRSKRGRDMRKYNPLEQEILFRRGTIFIVEKKEGNTLWLTEA